MTINNSNDLLSFLNISDDSFLIVKTDVVGNIKYVYIERKAIPTFCPECAARMHSKGLYTRKINHPVFQDSTQVILILKQRKWHCPNCGFYLNEEFSFVERYKQSTNLTPLMIINCMKDLNRTTSSVAKQFNLSDTQVHNIFTSLVDLKRLKLPEYISIDEVYMNISNSEKYAFVIMDFITGEIVDIVHNRWFSTLENYFYSIPLSERKNVKAIISDAYAPYLTSLPTMFPNAVSILDSFHVSRVLISKLNNYLYKLQKKYHELDIEKWKAKAKEMNRESIQGQDSNEVILLRNYKWIILKNKDDINYSTHKYYHKLLGMHVDTYSIEEMFLKIDPKLKKYRDLKESYISFNNGSYSNELEINTALSNLIKKFQASEEKIFIDFSNFLSMHKIEIVRSFTTLEVSRKTVNNDEQYFTRLSNGLMESFNRKPKDYKRNTRGASNFDYTRNRILWSTRINPPILGIPKPYDQVHSYHLPEKVLKKRSKTYKK